MYIRKSRTCRVDASCMLILIEGWQGLWNLQTSKKMEDAEFARI